MATLSLARKGAIILGATLALATLTGSAEARWYGCWGCGAFAAGAIAGAAIAAPYAPPVYYAPRPVVVAPPGAVGAVAQAAAGLITIEVAGAAVRVERGVDLDWLTTVLRAVKAAT